MEYTNGVNVNEADHQDEVCRNRTAARGDDRADGHRLFFLFGTEID